MYTKRSWTVEFIFVKTKRLRVIVVSLNSHTGVLMLQLNKYINDGNIQLSLFRNFQIRSFETTKLC